MKFASSEWLEETEHLEEYEYLEEAFLGAAAAQKATPGTTTRASGGSRRAGRIYRYW